MRARLKDKKNAQWELGIWCEEEICIYTYYSFAKVAV